MLYTALVNGITKGAPDEGWAISDAVIQLRRWGEDKPVCVLPTDGASELTVGSDETCSLRLEDPSGCVSRKHASLSREGSAWMLRDLGSMNGVRVDGELRQLLQLAPGSEIKIGGVVLVAESSRLIDLRLFLGRMFGWAQERRSYVDHALRLVREFATGRTALILCGEGEMTELCHRLHVLAVGEARPFVVATQSLADAVREAQAGTLCLVERCATAELIHLRDELRSPGAKTRLVVCCASRDDAMRVAGTLERTAVLDVPPLSHRRDELDRLILEFANDARAVFDAPTTGFRVHELQWLRPVSYRNLDHIAEVTTRVVALRNWGVKEASRRLGISHPALSQWAQRYGIPT